MYLIYRPDGGEEQRFVYRKNKVRANEAEILEKRTGQTYDQFYANLFAGSTLARRALLWMFLKRQHPTLRFEDVDFSLDELEVRFFKSEIVELIDRLGKAGKLDDDSASIFQAELDKAEDDPDDPKAAVAS